MVRESSARLLALLGLLQSRTVWTGGELAARLEVSARTVRNDIDRLRRLDYPVDAVRGRDGHYRLGVGAKLPPLLLDDEEAVAITVGLAAATGITGIEETSARALAKLEAILPHRLRRQVDAVRGAVSAGPENTGSNVPDPEIEVGLLTAIAAAIRDREEIRFDYRRPSSKGDDPLGPPRRANNTRARARAVAAGAALPPGQLAAAVVPGRPHRAYGRAGRPTGWTGCGCGRRAGRGSPRSSCRAATTPPSCSARSPSPAGPCTPGSGSTHPAAEVLARINPAVGVVEAVDDQTCVLVTGADSVEIIAVYIGMLGLDFSVDGPPELVAQLAVVGERYRRAVS